MIELYYFVKRKMKKKMKRLVSVIRDYYIELRTPGVHCCLEFRVIEFVTICFVTLFTN